MKDNLSFKTVINGQVYITEARNTANEKVCECKIIVDKSVDIWIISSWYTTEGNTNKGYGKRTMKACLDKISSENDSPWKIEYIWNGAHTYVLDWLNKNFGATNRCPIAVQKYQPDDDWDSHIYYLNTEKFIEYFELYKGNKK